MEKYQIVVGCDIVDGEEEFYSKKPLRAHTREEAAAFIKVLRQAVGGSRTGKLDVEDDEILEKLIEQLGYYCWVREIISVSKITEESVDLESL